MTMTAEQAAAMIELMTRIALAIEASNDKNEILNRIAFALESSIDQKAPNLTYSLGDYPGFDWNQINARVLETDGDGATAIDWSGRMYTRRSVQNKFDPAIWYSRSIGKNEEDGTNQYERLITFKTFSAVDPLPAKTLGAVSSARPTIRTQQPVNSPLPAQQTQLQPASIPIPTPQSAAASEDPTKWGGEEELEAAAAHPAPIDVSDLIQQIGVEVSRIKWTKKQGSTYLQQTYSKKTRAELTEQQLLEFLVHLKQLPAQQPATAAHF